MYIYSTIRSVFWKKKKKIQERAHTRGVGFNMIIPLFNPTWHKVNYLVFTIKKQRHTPPATPTCHTPPATSMWQQVERNYLN